MPIEDRNLKAGTKLVAHYHKQSYIGDVVEGESGKLKYRLQDGREFKSPSAAGMAITGKSCNGWAFWSIQKEEALSTAEAPAQQAEAARPQTADAVEPVNAGATAASETAKKPVKSPFFKLPNQRGAPAGQTRWYCRECSKGFLAPVGTTPEACPQGHRAG